jgi:CarD family transcriptional regulator
MEFAVGDEIVYGTHGVGRITARKRTKISGVPQEVVVLELAHGLTVTLPLERAQEQLRALATEAEIGRVKATLRQDRPLTTDPWLTRRQAVLAKLAGGNPVELAEIVSDGAQRERLLQASGKGTRLSPGEREIFTRARELLCDEIARSRGFEPELADLWIDRQLARAS